MNSLKHYIDYILEREKQRNLEMQDSYFKRLNSLPKGSLVIREISGHKYCYLRFRDGQKSVLKYFGTIEQLDLLNELICEREHCKSILKDLKEEYNRIERMGGIKWLFIMAVSWL